ncbi:MAG: bifunctional (p)ppGpp synthetase/guanosine-3',5'-bis(diphosphate) 3'-pyrophosphohydrolase [Proteobacteria bacterium]|nr:bifunctional (p)ppGpp synthetase/guanosine-3',5'-bis(diphosphate) 3'-pyrophosphohydrolase [Pseudomonadota bacterium]MDA0993489.1 bifunctional (p)ppGpp synthetase/guanosine-3',5'-bis(diphosphate) 3'-pyrophosphohydrolase [Pseudomonadota bacterium]
MSVSEQETRTSDVRLPEAELCARTILDSLPDQPAVASARLEGLEICSILGPLDLPPVLNAAVQLYPAAREGWIETKKLQVTSVPELGSLVEGLVQLGSFALPENWQPGEALATQQSETLRKMLLAVVSDARLVVARIGEQLYRLRRSKDASASQQRAIAVETQEIYAPLANRLGIWQLKWELEDLAFRFLDPDKYKQIATALKEKRTERETFIAGVKTTLQETLWKNGIRAEISGRPKHIYSIWRKMQQKEKDLDQIFDVRAVRILVDDINECYAALGIVHNVWAYLPGEFDDYIANPKDNDYQSLHTALIGPEGRTIEVQIRSHEMHRHAELGVAAHWRYKEGGSSKAAFEKKIRVLRYLLEPTDTDADLLDQIRGEIFEDRVYAVSPKGDVVEMPAQATPLDFAYHVHTQIGHRCRGAKVNGRIVPLTYHVQNGDKIEIITGKDEQPSRDWLSPQLGYLAATRSRAKVRNWFRHRDKDQNKRQGREILDRELSRLNIRDVSTDTIAKHLKFKNTETLCVALGAGDVSSAAVASALQNLRPDDTADKIRQRRPARKKQAKNDAIAISGIGDLLYTFARCCRPVPPEAIDGYITLGRGVSIHRKDCGNFLSLKKRHAERVIEVDWGGSTDAVYPAELTLHAFDRHGLLRDISTVLADEHVGVDNIRTDTDKRTMQVVMSLALAVPGLATLSRAISKLELLPNVTSVRRRS